MGNTSYSFRNAAVSRSANNTSTNSVEQNFKQAIEKKAHHSMNSKGITVRESRDSQLHPNSFPFIVSLDLTGSMQDIPQNLITTGLPKMISSIIQGGVQSPSLLFLGIGDHEHDSYPLQVGQFESGDAELDLWLHRTYIEGGGGGNNGESYSLAHFFAARHTATDSWDKRKKKGVLITIGDEPNLNSYPSRIIKEIMGTSDAVGFTAVDMLEEVKKTWEVYHINPRAEQQRNGWRDCKAYWDKFLGNGYIPCASYTEIPNIIAKLVVKHGIEEFVEGRDNSRDYPDDLLEEEIL